MQRTTTPPPAIDEASVRAKYARLTRRLIATKTTITTMESCTAGQVASLITDTEGASEIMKGAFITCGIMNMDDRAVNEKQQGEFLSRALLIALQCGVERFFWYEFQAPEWDDNDGESHFGIVHRDFQPKPAFASYWTLTKCRPASSVTIDGNWKDETVHYYYPQWKLPDGRIAGAVWTLSAPRDYQFTFSDQVTFTNYQGKKLNPKWDMEKRQVVLHLDSGPIYFTGAKLVEAKPLE